MAKDRRTPTTKAIGVLEMDGWLAGIVERKAGVISFDLFGFADVVAINPDGDGTTLALQVTSAGDVYRRVEKLLANENVPKCLACGWRVEVWGIRHEPTRDGRMLKARTFKLEDDEVTVIDGSLVKPDF